LARKACDLSQHRDPDALDALAAAFAESGRYEAALEFARKAAAAAELQGDNPACWSDSPARVFVRNQTSISGVMPGPESG
jgi:hypothetical protein